MNMRTQDNEDGTVTDLLLAVYGGRTEDVECLLAAGADVNLTDADGLTPLMASAMNGSSIIARLLLDAGADPSMRDKWHLTANTIAEFFGHSDLAALLAERLHAAEAGKQFASSPDVLPEQGLNLSY